MMVARTLVLMFVTAVAEISGCYLVYLWVRQGARPMVLIPAAASLAAFAWLLTFHPTAAGRTFAAYGGIYIASSVGWLWFVEKHPPDRWDLLGASIAVAGAAVILFGPRTIQPVVEGSAETHVTKKNEPGPMTRYPKFAYERGPALVPADALFAWLDAQVKADGSQRLVRFPVTVERDVTSRSAWIGSAGGPVIALDDTALGVSLDDHARQHRGEDKRAHLLVEGYWKRDGARCELSLRRVHGPSVAGADFAEVVVDDSVKGLPP